jgi:hypothetical protein
MAEQSEEGCQSGSVRECSDCLDQQLAALVYVTLHGTDEFLAVIIRHDE